MAGAAVKLSTIKCVDVQGCKYGWKIHEKDTVMVHDACYVRLCPNNTALVSIVSPGSKRKTLSDSLGLLGLMRLRNDEQIAHLESECAVDIPSPCSLFAADECEERGPKKRRLKRETIKGLRQSDPRPWIA